MLANVHVFRTHLVLGDGSHEVLWNEFGQDDHLASVVHGRPHSDIHSEGVEHGQNTNGDLLRSTGHRLLAHLHDEITKPTHLSARMTFGAF